MISLSRRVTLASTLVLVSFAAVTALALEQAFEQSARAAMRERLFAQLYLVMAAAELDDNAQLKMPPQLGEPRLNLPGSGLMARIGDGRGTTLWHSPSALGRTLPAPSGITNGELFALNYLNGEPYFSAALAIEWQTGQGTTPLLFSVVEDHRPFREQMTRYRHTLWGWLGAMALVAVAALAAALAWGLRPLRTVANELRAIEDGTQEGLVNSYPRELQQLTDNLNTLLRHEHAQQARYKHALGDLAHSLKTPLAVLRGLGDGAGTQAPLLHEQVDRMDSIVQYQLQRAATAGRSALAPPLPLRPTLKRVLATLQKVYHDKGVRVELAIADGALFRGDEGDMMELLGNLLDNAFKWCQGTVLISARHDHHTLTLEVADDGPGIDEQQTATVLQRGGRLDEATPGHGIGLPIVRDIVAAYGGQLQLGRSQLGGAAFTLRLPGG